MKMQIRDQLRDSDDDSIRISISELRRLSKYAGKTDDELASKADAYYKICLFLLDVEQNRKSKNNE